MSKSGQRFDNKQLSIFDLLTSLSEPAHTSAIGRLKIEDPLKAAMRQAIKNCPLSVHQIAGEMSHLLNESITADIIYSWTRESDKQNGRPGRHVPAEYLPAFCAVTCDNEPLRVMGRVAGVFVMPGPEALRAEIQKIDEEINRAKAQKRKRMMFLQEIEK
ncbi:MAG: hypothetical protein SV487_06730 [Thermodesulfobacteriota bacterium]|nr:hypothetical protein [Thermodesulfobacteriota bacterium]